MVKVVLAYSAPTVPVALAATGVTYLLQPAGGGSGGAAGTGGGGGAAGAAGAAGHVIIGSTDASANLLVVDVKNTSGDPTGQAGAMYYNSNSAQFRCFTTTWIACTASGATPDLQTVYGNDADGSDAMISLLAADDSLVFRNPSSAGSGSELWLRLSNLTPLVLGRPRSH